MEASPKKNLYKWVLQLAAPIALQNIIAMSVGLADNLMVGSLGEHALSGVFAANQLQNLLHMLVIGLSTALTVLAIQYWGKKDLKSIKDLIGIALKFSLGAGLLFLLATLFFPDQIIGIFSDVPDVKKEALDYLKIIRYTYIFFCVTQVLIASMRCVETVKVAMYLSIVTFFVNVFFNWVFIFGNLGAPALGVKGAAIATLIARAVETIIIIISVYAGKGVLAASPGVLSGFNCQYVKKSYTIILPVILNDMCWGTASLVYTAVYGRMGTQAVAVIQIVNTINNLFLVTIFGISNAAAVMVGNSIGAGKMNQGRFYAGRFAVLSVIAGILLGILLSTFSPYILSFFNVSSKVQNDARVILNMAAAVFAVRILNTTIIVGVLRGGGDARFALMAEGLTMWFIGVPLTIISALVFGFPVHLVYAAGLMEEIVKSIVVLFRLASGRWIRNVTYGLSSG